MVESSKTEPDSGMGVPSMAKRIGVVGGRSPLSIDLEREDSARDDDGEGGTGAPPGVDGSWRFFFALAPAAKIHLLTSTNTKV